jgi:hypothetical protein
MPRAQVARRDRPYPYIQTIARAGYNELRRSPVRTAGYITRAYTAAQRRLQATPPPTPQAVQQYRRDYNHYQNRIGSKKRVHMPKSKSSKRKPRFSAPTGSKYHKRKHRKKLVIVSKKQVKKWNKAATKVNIDLSKQERYERSIELTTSSKNRTNFEVEELLGFNRATLLNNLDQRKVMVSELTSVNLTAHEVNPVLSASQQKIQCKIASSAHYMNNFAIPQWVDVYCFEVKADTNFSPRDAFVAGMLDIGTAGGVALDSIFSYPTHSPVLNGLWKIASHKKVCLAPGESVSLGYHKSFMFDKSFYDSHNTSYVKQFASHIFGVRVQGVFGHAETPVLLPAFEAGSSKTSIDWYVDRHFTCTYDAGGAKFKTKEYVDAQNANTDIVVGWPTNAENTKGTPLP